MERRGLLGRPILISSPVLLHLFSQEIDQGGYRELLLALAIDARPQLPRIWNINAV